MDSLDHMLTDPLELGPCGDGQGSRIMEDCLLGGTRVSLPEDLLEDVSSDIHTVVSLFPSKSSSLQSFLHSASFQDFVLPSL